MAERESAKRVMKAAILAAWRKLARAQIGARASRLLLREAATVGP